MSALKFFLRLLIDAVLIAASNERYVYSFIYGLFNDTVSQTV
jgi:hypothetical protein